MVFVIVVSEQVRLSSTADELEKCPHGVQIPILGASPGTGYRASNVRRIRYCHGSWCGGRETEKERFSNLGIIFPSGFLRKLLCQRSNLQVVFQVHIVFAVEVGTGESSPLDQFLNNTLCDAHWRQYVSYVEQKHFTGLHNLPVLFQAGCLSQIFRVLHLPHFLTKPE